MLNPPISAPSARAARTWTRESAIVELLRGRLSIVGPTTASDLGAALAITETDATAALLTLESEGAVLRVFPERTSKVDDELLRGYFDDLRISGHPFDKKNAADYSPLTAEQYKTVLYDFKTKFKSSAMAQVADMYLWPMCMGGYHRSNRAYKALVEAGKLIDCRLEGKQLAELGVKYSCFENVNVTP